MTDAEIEKLNPEIRWRNPIRIQVIDRGWGYACRLCVARHGFKSAEADKLFKTEAEFYEHQGKHHPPVA